MSRKNILIRYFYLNVENLSYSLYLSLISVKTMTEKDQKLSIMKNPKIEFIEQNLETPEKNPKSFFRKMMHASVHPKTPKNALKLFRRHDPSKVRVFEVDS